jgi:hypothetical protein
MRTIGAATLIVVIASSSSRVWAVNGAGELDRRAVDEPVDRMPRRGLGAGGEPLGRLEVAQVAGDRARVAAHPRADAREAGLVAVAEHEPRARAVQGLGDVATDPARRAGEQDGAALKLHV